MQFFQQRRLNKLRQCIETDDVSGLKKQLSKLDTVTLDDVFLTMDAEQLSLTEAAIQQAASGCLQQLLESGCHANRQNDKGEPLLYQALQHPQHSLKLITVLLQAGADTGPLQNAGELPETPLLACFDYQVTPLTLHISRLIENQADALYTDKHGHNLLHKALPLGDQNLIQLLISSNVSLPENAAELCPPEIHNYAKRFADDLRIRRMMLG